MTTLAVSAWVPRDPTLHTLQQSCPSGPLSSRPSLQGCGFCSSGACLPPSSRLSHPHVHRWTVTSQWCVPVRTPLGTQWIRQTQSERESKRLKQTEQTPATELAGLQATNPASFSGLSCHRCLPGYTIAGQWNRHAYSGTPALDAGTAACLVATGYSLIPGLSLQQELDNSRLVFEPI